MNQITHQPQTIESLFICQKKSAVDLENKTTGIAFLHPVNALHETYIYIPGVFYKLIEPANYLNALTLSRKCPFVAHVINYKSVFARGSPSS